MVSVQSAKQGATFARLEACLRHIARPCLQRNYVASHKFCLQLSPETSMSQNGSSLRSECHPKIPRCSTLPVSWSKSWRGQWASAEPLMPLGGVG